MNESGDPLINWTDEHRKAARLDEISRTVRHLLSLIGEDPEREGLLETPDRVARAWQELTAGYGQDPKSLLSKSFTSDCDEMVVKRGIPFFSLCEHHCLPIQGTVTVAYIPQGRVVGLSKITRLVDCFARRLQIQEQMTVQVADAMQEHLKPKGVGVLVKAQHFCEAMRGVNRSAEMITSALRGAMKTDEATRAEFLRLAHAA